ncbi:hypothetical protein CPB85DRAFT_1284214 [Mucidula mucida]|nr:hypothetical protein CPB85DRAFT_1284214 [Mucidula mucida]
MSIVLLKSWLFSLERVKRLTFSFTTDEADSSGSEEMMHGILDALPLPLQELCFKCHESLSLRSDSRLVPVATISRIAFDIYQDGKPLETIKWWTRNLVDAWVNRRDRWAIQEIRVNVITDCNVRYPDKGVFDDLLARDAWDPLDSILAVLKLEKLVFCVQALESIYEEEAMEFERLFKERLPLSRAREIFYWGTMLRLWRYE